MKIAPFEIEHYFARYEFNTPYLLCSSDCETISVTELLDMGGYSAADLGKLKLGYTESQGSPSLRTEIAKNYGTVNPDDVIVLASPEEGIYLAMRALLDKGDHVVVATPAYDSLLNLAQHVSGNINRWEVRAEESGWVFDVDDLAALVTAQTKLIVINFPHNPTGFLPDPDQLNAIVEIARSNGAWVFCDEMYRGLELNGFDTLPSMVTVAEQSLVLAGLSKVHGLPGLRSGWLVVRDKDLRAEILNWKFYTSICPPAPSEFLAQVALQAQEHILKRNRNLVERNVATANDFFQRWPSMFTWYAPQAGSIALVGLHQPSADVFCHQLAQEAGVLLLPSTCLGYGDQHVRMGFGRTNFDEALRQFENYLHQIGA